MVEVKTGSGADLVVNSAPFKDMFALKNAVAMEIAAAKIDIDLKALKNLMNADLTDVVHLILAIDSSERVNQALMTCMQRSTYNGQKIDWATFNNEKAREDYYEIVFHCAKVNLGPFGKSLLSVSNGLRLPTTESTQK